MGLPCLNCGCDVPSKEAKIFAKCFLCADCHTIAARLYNQGNNELEHMKVVLKEVIQSAITRKQLAVPPPPEKDDYGMVRQPKAIELLVQMMKSQKDDECTSPQRSTKCSEKPSTNAPARTLVAGGPPSSSSSAEQTSSPETPSTGTPATEPSDNA